MDTVLSPEEFEQAIYALPVAGMSRLRKAAAAFCRGTTLEPNDILQEAFKRTLIGDRRCPVGVDVVKFLADAMHSIVSDEIKKRMRRRELQTVPLFADDGLAYDTPDPAASAEDVLVDAQEARRMRQAVIELFADDLTAQVIVEGMMEGMEGEELRKLADLTKIGFASKRRLIRRRIDKACLQGSMP